MGLKRWSSRGDAAELAAAQTEMSARETSNLIVDDPHGVVTSFLDLSIRTLVWLPDHLRSWFKMDANSAFCGTFQMRSWTDMPPDIEKGWSGWRAVYAGLVARNPRLELADMMERISEIVDSSSWPDGYEDDLMRWVDRGERLPLPRPLGAWAEKQIGIVFFERLCDLRQLTGGWVFYDHAMTRPVFMTDAEMLEP